MFYQVRFRIINPDFDDDTNKTYGGIAEYYNKDTPIRIICGHCGSIFEPNDVEILEKYDNWMDLTETIVGD